MPDSRRQGGTEAVLVDIYQKEVLPKTCPTSPENETPGIVEKGQIPFVTW